MALSCFHALPSGLQPDVYTLTEALAALSSAAAWVKALELLRGSGIQADLAAWHLKVD